MSHLKQTELMYAVLDGEATPSEALELERLVAADPAARAQFEQLRRLFDALASVPKAFPPEGLVASVMARMPREATRPDRFGPTFVDVACIWARIEESLGQQPRGVGNGPSGLSTRAISQGYNNERTANRPLSASARSGSAWESQRQPWSLRCSTQVTSPFREGCGWNDCSGAKVPGSAEHRRRGRGLGWQPVHAGRGGDSGQCRQ